MMDKKDYIIEFVNSLKRSSQETPSQYFKELQEIWNDLDFLLVEDEEPTFYNQFLNSALSEKKAKRKTDIGRHRSGSKLIVSMLAVAAVILIITLRINIDTKKFEDMTINKMALNNEVEDIRDEIMELSKIRSNSSLENHNLNYLLDQICCHPNKNVRLVAIESYRKHIDNNSATRLAESLESQNSVLIASKIYQILDQNQVIESIPILLRRSRNKNISQIELNILEQTISNLKNYE